MSPTRIATVLFSLFMVGIAAWYVSNHWTDIQRVKLVNPSSLLVVAVLIFARMTLRGCFHWQILKSLDVKIPFKEALALNYTGTMMNLLLPMPIGPGYRAAYLKRKFDFPFSLFASTLAALFVYWMLVSSSLGLVASIWFFMTKGLVDWGIISILCCAVGASLFTFFVPIIFKNSLQAPSNWLAKRLQKIATGWNTIVASKNLVLGATLVVIASTIVSAMAMFFAFRTVGISIGLPGALLLMSSQRIGSLIKLTPGAIGYQEMVGVYFASLLHPTSAEAAVVFGLTRIISSLVGVLVGLPAIWTLNGESFSRVEPNAGQTGNNVMDDSTNVVEDNSP